MRGMLSGLAALVALVALLVTMPVLWVSTHVADENGYVTFSSELARDDGLQRAFSAYLSDELARRGVVPDALEPTVARALSQAARRTSNESGFVGAWEETQRSFHRSAFADGASAALAVDLGPLAAFVTERVTRRLPVTLTVPDDLVVPVVSDAQDREAIDAIERSTHQSRLGLLVAAGAALACLLLARRRSAALLGLGVGTLLVAGLLRLLSGPTTQRVLNRTEAPTEFARNLQKLLAERAADSLAGWLVWLAVAGAVAAVAGFGGRLLAGRA